MTAKCSMSTICLLLVFLIDIAAAISRGMFVNPYPQSANMFSVADPAQQFVYLIGSTTNLTWQTTLDPYSCYLYQQNLTEFSARSAYQQNPVYSKGIQAAELGTSSWNVRTGSFSLDDSPIFFIRCISDISGNDGLAQYFESFYFNLTTDPSDPRLDVSRQQIARNIAANEIALGRVSLPGTNTTNDACPTSPDTGLSSSAKVGLGVGIGLGVPILIVLGIIAYKLLQPTRAQELPTPAPATDLKTAPQSPWSAQHFASPHLGSFEVPRAQSPVEVEGDSANVSNRRSEAP